MDNFQTRLSRWLKTMREKYGLGPTQGSHYGGMGNWCLLMRANNSTAKSLPLCSETTKEICGWVLRAPEFLNFTMANLFHWRTLLSKNCSRILIVCWSIKPGKFGSAREKILSCAVMVINGVRIR